MIRAAPGVPPARPAASMSDINVAATHALALLKERGKKKNATLPPSDQSNEESKMLAEKLSTKKPQKDFTSKYNPNPLTSTQLERSISLCSIPSHFDLRQYYHSNYQANQLYSNG